MAALDEQSGKCSKCRTGNNWFKNPNSESCKCEHFVDTLDGNKCKTCQDLFDGCAKCEYSETDIKGELVKKIGYNKELSNSQLQYVKCKDCGDLLRNSAGTGCIDCNELFPGCKWCNRDGKSCDECH